MIKEAIALVIDGQDLSENEMVDVMDQIMGGEAQSEIALAPSISTYGFSDSINFFSINGRVLRLSSLTRAWIAAPLRRKS